MSIVVGSSTSVGLLTGESASTVAGSAKRLGTVRLLLSRKRPVRHTSRVAVLVQQGLRFMAETVTETNELVASVDEEEDYENIVELEDEIDD